MLFKIHSNKNNYNFVTIQKYNNLMISKVCSATVYGIDGKLITVEVDIARGLPCLSIVGLPDSSVKEARDRVVAAIRNSGFDFPTKKITVNLPSLPAGTHERR
jgi:hypothetical protein